MGLFDIFRPKLNEKQFSQLQSILSTRLQQQLNTLNLYPNYKGLKNIDRYCTTDDVYSIIRLLSTTAAMIPFYGYTKDSDGELVDLPEEHPLNVLLEQPLVGFNKFDGLFAVYATLYGQGEVFLYKEKPELGPNAGKEKLHYLNPQNVVIRVTADFPRRIVAIDYVEGGKTIFQNIPYEEVIHVKYFNPNLGITDDGLRGLSPLDVLLKRMTQGDAQVDVTTAQLQNGGLPGIVYDDMPYDSAIEVMNAHKDNFARYLNSSSNKSAPYFTSGKLNYIAIGTKLAELEVIELGKITFKKMCNAFGVSDVLFNNDAGSTENNVAWANKRLYTNTILPDVIRLRDALNKGLIKDWKLYINYDISEISELQDNMKDMVGWLSQAWWLTPNEKRSAMKYDAIADPLFDEILLPTGIQTIEDLQAPEPLPNTGDYNKPNQ